jgi:hypothetical protein
MLKKCLLLVAFAAFIPSFAANPWLDAVKVTQIVALNDTTFQIKVRCIIPQPSGTCDSAVWYIANMTELGATQFDRLFTICIASGTKNLGIHMDYNLTTHHITNIGLNCP